MQKQIITLTALTFGLATALADTRIADLRSHAQSVQRDSQAMSQLLKAKSPDLQQLREKLDATGTDIEKLQALVADMDRAAPGPSRDWQLVKDKVQLLAIFHKAKRDIVTSDQIGKNRSMLRAHADGVAKRARMLQETVSRLAP